MTHENDTELLVKEACDLMRFKRTTFYTRVRSGAFPSHLNNTGRRVVWKSDLLSFREQEAGKRTALKPPPSRS